MDDSLNELQHQLLAAARGVVVIALVWLAALGLIALRHRRSPERALAALRGLGAPWLICRLLLLAVCASTVHPAYAGQLGSEPARDLTEALHGLPSPELPAPGPVVARDERRPAAGSCLHRVRPGESLWSITAETLEDAPRPGISVDLGWRRLYAANAAEIGDDPHLVHPGARLDLSALDRSCARAASQPSHHPSPTTRPSPRPGATS